MPLFGEKQGSLAFVMFVGTLPMACCLANAQSSAIVVSDSANNRVLIYSLPIHAKQSASVVLGQADFVHGKVNRGGVQTPNTLNFPTALARDPEGNLFVSDNGNCRILRFRPPFTNGMDADLVIPLAAAGTGTCGLDEAISGTKLPIDILGLAFDADGNLWASDAANSHVVELVAPLGPKTKPSIMLGMQKRGGQINGLCWGYDTSGTTLCFPVGIVFDEHGDLWVADLNDNRILEFVPPFSAGMAASLELGQPPDSAFTTRKSEGTGYGPECPTYQEPGLTGQQRQRAPSATCAVVTDRSLYGPRSLAFGRDDGLWVVDGHHQRVLKFAPPFSNGMAAALVLDPARTNSSSVATDSDGRAIVIQSEGVLKIFAPPFRSGMAPTAELGSSGPFDFNARHSNDSTRGERSIDGRLITAESWDNATDVLSY